MRLENHDTSWYRISPKWLSLLLSAFCLCCRPSDSSRELRSSTLPRQSETVPRSNSFTQLSTTHHLVEERKESLTRKNSESIDLDITLEDTSKVGWIFFFFTSLETILIWGFNSVVSLVNVIYSLWIPSPSTQLSF